MSHDKLIKNPCDKNNLIHLIKVCILESEGWIYYLYNVEIEGIGLVCKCILKYTFFLRNKNMFI